PVFAPLTRLERCRRAVTTGREQMSFKHATSSTLFVCLVSVALPALTLAQPPGFPPGLPAGYPGAAPPPPAALQPPGPKAAGKLRIGVAPSQAQLGQGNNAKGDYGASIRNSIVLLMNGPAVEIVPLDAHLMMQLQAEAQQKECDYVLFSNVTV